MSYRSLVEGETNDSVRLVRVCWEEPKSLEFEALLEARVVVEALLPVILREGGEERAAGVAVKEGDAEAAGTVDVASAVAMV